ncbi:hypothetical protein A9Y76_03425 [Ralstonia insidiosa]|uniref:Uncharacterized protein n=1 Tax=Ralstonia insidiosa TaxID=190721 RepID=A0A191ZU14_9RALS|nr:hypothetical protein [Ralstonia insidiosa]ANJ71586.1 hypothetical protein A9Y76_03425 [Ralstonia insidiosa]
MITAEVSAYSRESAEATLNEALKIFAVPHQKLFDQTIKDLQGNLAIAQSKLTGTQNDYARIGDALKLAVTSGATTPSARDILASNTATLINAQLLTLQQQVGAYQDALTPLRTYPTAALGPTYVPKQSSTPSTTVFIVSGAVVGLMFAAGLTLLKNSARAA